MAIIPVLMLTISNVNASGKTIDCPDGYHIEEKEGDGTERVLLI